MRCRHYVINDVLLLMLLLLIGTADNRSLMTTQPGKLYVLRLCSPVERNLLVSCH